MSADNAKVKKAITDSKLYIFTMLESKKTEYVSYMVVERTQNEDWEIKDSCTNIACASKVDEAGITKIYKFGKRFWIFQNSDSVVWLKTVYLDIEKMHDILDM